MNNNQDFNNNFYNNNQGQQNILQNNGTIPNNNNFYNGIDETSNVDLPPDLGNIPNLNEAIVSKAPSMDVLGPMNIMPESPAASSDPLEQYDNQGINNQVQSSSNPFSADSFGQVPMFQNQNMINNNENIMPQYPPYNIDPMTSNQQTEENMYNPDFNNQANSFQPTNLQTNFNNTTQQNNIINNNQFDNQSNNNSLLVDNYSNNNENIIPTDIVSTNLTNNSDSNFNVVNTQSNFSEFAENNNLPIGNNSNNNENIIITTKNLADTTNVNNLDSNLNNNEANSINPLNNTNSNSINNDYSVVNQSINNLNPEINKSYDEPDSMEIMDIDDSTEEKTNQINGEDSNDTHGLVSKNVELIKELIEQLKQKGANIEFEEFDFETMYQLVVKINK